MVRTIKINQVCHEKEVRKSFLFCSPYLNLLAARFEYKKFKNKING